LAQRRFNERLVELGRECSPEWTALDGVAFTRRPRGTVSRSFAEKYFVGSPQPSDQARQGASGSKHSLT
jgi:hypothetical protein